MRISHSKKFAFISRPKCASTSIRKFLDPYSEIKSKKTPPIFHHLTACELEDVFIEQNWDISEYFVITSIRNPWDLIVSYYKHFKPDINGIYNWEQSRFGKMYNPNQLCSFSEWIFTGMSHFRKKNINSKIMTDLWEIGFSKLSLKTAINGNNNNIIINDYIKVENIQYDMKRISNIIGIPYSKIEHTNRSQRKPYQYYYSSATKNHIEKEFASDIEFGKYIF